MIQLQNGQSMDAHIAAVGTTGEQLPHIDVQLYMNSAVHLLRGNTPAATLQELDTIISTLQVLRHRLSSKLYWEATKRARGSLPAAAEVATSEVTVTEVARGE